ncbi:MAG TPA: TonB family protein [Xanthobacteraceae bacterium]|nr:TonB family protein [Xanthobacteraceae bacterium]
MSVTSLAWFDDETPRDLRRWALAAAVVLGVHVAAIAAYVYVHRPDEIGDDTTPIAVDFSPTDDTIDQPEVAPTPEQPPPEVEKPPPPPPPPPPQPEAVAEPEKPPPPPKVEEQKPPTPPMPARSKGGAPHIAPAWQTVLVRHLEQYKRYPSEAQDRGEQGVVLLGFSVDRTGHVLEHRIVRSSGYTALDNEVMAMIERAQPLPPFPASMTEAKLDLTVPIRFSLR